MPRLQSSLFATATLVATALSSPTPVMRRSEPSTITLTEAPLITEVVPYFTETETTIQNPGTYTLGVGCLSILGVECLVEVKDIPAPTVVTLTGVGTRTTTYTPSTSTTFTSTTYDAGCDCLLSKVFCWLPHPTHPTVTSTTTPAPVTPTVTTTSVTVTETATASCSSVPAPTPTLSCDEYGYLIQVATLYRVDLVTGEFTTVRQSVGDGSSINAIAYNTRDNFLYARQGAANRILRISSDGSSEVIGRLPDSSSYNVGDIDSSGYYWYGRAGQNWHQLDLIPGSPTYGTLVANGTTDNLGLGIADWAYIPVAGPYLWAATTSSRAGETTLSRFRLESKTWEVVSRHPGMGNRGWGAVYGMNNGTLFASDNLSGQIWAFPVLPGGGSPYLASNGPRSGQNDGARCVFNLLTN
ncbi:hypothetical protein GGS23DRAFT_471115 [Durotheca rogersii]|uniref:uncharacterized protein n=1 Tax=Durotheca rogersii TaxID=419775 RepID=UPI002220B699|nr:uncharacterized protein GGS23DRAFT_471115 [Durotheca rogersii]KAI5854999.1 hypothetical protein GGS23DRAFT_471115 [Durotheca rogersii]